MTQEQFDGFIKGWKIAKRAVKIAYNFVIIGLLAFLIHWNAQLQATVTLHEQNEVVLVKIINAMNNELGAIEHALGGANPQPQQSPHGQKEPTTNL